MYLDEHIQQQEKVKEIEDELERRRQIRLKFDKEAALEDEKNKNKFELYDLESLKIHRFLEEIESLSYDSENENENENKKDKNKNSEKKEKEDEINVVKSPELDIDASFGSDTLRKQLLSHQGRSFRNLNVIDFEDTQYNQNSKTQRNPILQRSLTTLKQGYFWGYVNCEILSRYLGIYLLLFFDFFVCVFSLCLFLFFCFWCFLFVGQYNVRPGRGSRGELRNCYPLVSCAVPISEVARSR